MRLVGRKANRKKQTKKSCERGETLLLLLWCAHNRGHKQEVHTEIEGCLLYVFLQVLKHIGGVRERKIYISELLTPVLSQILVLLMMRKKLVHRERRKSLWIVCRCVTGCCGEESREARSRCRQEEWEHIRLRRIDSYVERISSSALGELWWREGCFWEPWTRGMWTGGAKKRWSAHTIEVGRRRIVVYANMDEAGGQQHGGAEFGPPPDDLLESFPLHVVSLPEQSPRPRLLGHFVSSDCFLSYTKHKFLFLGAHRCLLLMEQAHLLSMSFFACFGEYVACERTISYKHCRCTMPVFFTSVEQLIKTSPALINSSARVANISF